MNATIRNPQRPRRPNNFAIVFIFWPTTLQVPICRPENLFLPYGSNGASIADQTYLEFATVALILNALDEAALNGAMSLMNSVDGDSAATSRS
jgi:hypothetical protein